MAACSNDEDSPAEPTGLGDTADVPDASVRDLPGDGLEPTPDFDIEARQRDPIGPERISEGIDALQNGAGGTAGDGSPDAAAPSGATDAGTANGAN
jgi:hypothetical protein